MGPLRLRCEIEKGRQTGRIELNVAIRTIGLTGRPDPESNSLTGMLDYGAGGGIVADSDPEQEWQESNHKARALAQALGFDPEEAS